MEKYSLQYNMKMLSVSDIKPGFNYVDKENVYLPNVNKIVLAGDIGCTGFFGESKKVLERILTLNTDIFFFLGDLICTGIEYEFQEIINFCNSRVQVPIFALRGNHDMRHYKDFLGLLSYTLVLDKFICIFLDNPLGYFLDHDIEFLERELNKNKNRSALIFMHVPPPTDIYSAHLPESEWEKIRTIMDKHKERIKHIFSAHIHGYHDYSIDGYPVTITAGGGAAMIHNLNKKEQKFYHAVIINLHQDGSLIKEVIPV